MSNRTFSGLLELEGHTLKRGDCLKFPGLRYSYVVGSNALLNEECSHTGDIFNDKVFDVLGIEDHHGFCEEHYGYPTCGPRGIRGQFPLCEEKDFVALTNVSKALFNEFEKQSS